jgi:peptide/nickel transport system substrate-binding protein
VAQAEHNLKEIIFTPIGSDATRVAALLSGEVDVIEPVPIQDIRGSIPARTPRC